MLAVVENQQQGTILDKLDQCFGHRAPRLFLDAQHRCHRLRHQLRIGDWRELHEPDAIRIFVEHVGCDLQRKAGLAEAADAVKRHQSRFAQHLLHFGELALAADERRDLVRQVVRRRLHRAQRGKLGTQLRPDDLIHALGMREIAQPHAAEIAQRNPRR